MCSELQDAITSSKYVQHERSDTFNNLVITTVDQTDHSQFGNRRDWHSLTNFSENHLDPRKDQKLMIHCAAGAKKQYFKPKNFAF